MMNNLSYMESGSNGDLPAEIVLEILLKLPVKTLLRFKCVCKQWYTLIGSPSFVNQHFSHESNQERLLIRHYKPNEDRYAIALYVDDLLSRYEEPDHLQMVDSVEALMGPLNGVFCMFSTSRNIILLNPAMRQFKPIPSHALNAEPHLSVYDDVVGFGFDPLSGDYMVFSTRYLFGQGGGVTDPRHASIYNLSTDSWRHIEDVGLANLMCRADRRCSTCLNGIYHCVTWLDKGGAAILAFDTNSDKYREIQVPDCINYVGELEIALYGNTIALLSYNTDRGKDDKSVNVWVMKEEGCWTKISTLGPFEDIERPLCFWKNNELLVETHDTSSLTLCDVSTLDLRTIEARRKGRSFSGWVFSYKESLVSIKREGNSCILWDTSNYLVNYYLR